MMGSHDQNQTGLIPRLCDELFDRISKVNMEKFNHFFVLFHYIYLFSTYAVLFTMPLSRMMMRTLHTKLKFLTLRSIMKK